MSRISDAFARLRSRGEAALIPFLMAGDPDLPGTLELARAVEEAGADLLELGVPFSDPTADGPVIQRSSEHALRQGASLPRVLEIVHDFRRSSELPVVLFGYYNPIFRYGPERFARDARQAGVDGCLVVDLPPEDAGELRQWTERAGLDMIFLLAPTTEPDRVKRILSLARGFVYYVSVTGVTGMRPVLPEELASSVAAVRRMGRIPVGVGFGISSPAQAAAVADFADAVIVGSAIMKIVQEHRADGAAARCVGEFVRDLKAAIRARSGGARA